MKIVVLDGAGLNPGDLSWAGLEALGDVTVYDQTAPEDTQARMSGADIVLTNKTLLTAALMGGALSVSGFLLQTFFRNPIAGPYVLGISASAKMMVGLALVFGQELWGRRNNIVVLN